MKKKIQIINRILLSSCALYTRVPTSFSMFFQSFHFSSSFIYNWYKIIGHCSASVIITWPYHNNCVDFVVLIMLHNLPVLRLFAAFRILPNYNNQHALLKKSISTVISCLLPISALDTYVTDFQIVSFVKSISGDHSNAFNNRVDFLPCCIPSFMSLLDVRSVDIMLHAYSNSSPCLFSVINK